MDSGDNKPDGFQLLHQLSPRRDDLGTAEAPVTVEEDQVRLLVAVRDQCVGICLVCDALFVEYILPVPIRLETVEIISKQIT